MLVGQPVVLVSPRQRAAHLVAEELLPGPPVEKHQVRREVALPVLQWWYRRQQLTGELLGRLPWVPLLLVQSVYWPELLAAERQQFGYRGTGCCRAEGSSAHAAAGGTAACCCDVVDQNVVRT